MSIYKNKINPYTGKLQKIFKGTIVSFKPAVATSGDLPSSGNIDGDARVVADTGKLYVWDADTSSWNDQGAFIDLAWDLLDGKPSSTPVQIDDAVTKRHTQNTDTKLDEGGANEVSASETKTAYDHSQVSTGNPHSVSKSDVNLGNVPNVDATDADNIDIDDSGAIITATDVEGALQENRVAIDLNTTHRGITTGNPHSVSASDVGLGSVEDGADITDSENVDSAGAVMEEDYNANTILKADINDTPSALTVSEQTFVGRKTGGNIDALSASEARTILSVEENSVSLSTVKADSDISDAISHIFLTNNPHSVTLQQAFDNGQTITIANGDNQTFSITNNDTTNNQTTAVIDNNTSGYAMYIDQSAELNTTRHALYVFSTAQQTNEPLVYFTNSNASTTQPVLNVKQLHGDGIGNVIDIRNSGTGIGLRIDQNGNGQGMLITNSGTEDALQVIQDEVLDTNESTVKIYNNSSAITNSGSHLFQIYSNVAGSTQPLSQIWNDNASCSSTCLEIDNDGTGHGLYLHQGVLASGKYGLYVYSNAVQVNTALAYLRQDNASSTEPLMQLYNDGTGPALQITQNGDVAHLRFTGDPANSSPTDGDFWFDGTNFKVRIASTTYTLDKTSV